MSSACWWDGLSKLGSADSNFSACFYTVELFASEIPIIDYSMPLSSDLKLMGLTFADVYSLCWMIDFEIRLSTRLLNLV